MLTKIGLDLGYANVTLSNAVSGVYREPSIALLDVNAGSEAERLISFGRAAEEGKAGGKGCAPVRPFVKGILHDRTLTCDIVRQMLSAIKPTDKIRCAIGLPSDFISKQEKELFDVVREAGIDSVVGVCRSIAALVGAGHSPTTSAISVNIGAASTEIAVVHVGNIIYLKRYDVGGESFDRAVKDYIKRNGDVDISLSMARAIKERLGAVWRGKEDGSVEIEGTLSLTGNNIRMTVSTEDIVGVFEQPMQALLDCIVDAVKHTPKDSAKDVYCNGIVLTGGGAELFGIATLIERVLGITVTRPDSPIDSVARGLAIINKLLPARTKFDGHNITAQVSKLYQGSK